MSVPDDDEQVGVGDRHITGGRSGLEGAGQQRFGGVRQIEHLQAAPTTEVNFRGVGEGGAIAPPVVIANAVSDALRPFKAEFNRTPVTPQAIDAVVRRRITSPQAR